MARKNKKRRRYRKINRIYTIILELIIITAMIVIIATMVSKNVVVKQKKQDTDQIDTSQELEADNNGQNSEITEAAMTENTELSDSSQEESINTSGDSVEALGAAGDTETEATDDNTGNIDMAENNQSGEIAEEQNEAETVMQQTEALPQIALDGLSTESLGWGQGVNFDELNRPVGSLNYQDKYGKYQAYFIAEPDQVIYLTFDEGYEYGCTPEILDVLKDKGVKAVFFITLPYAKQNPELVQRMIDEGHQLGNHSVTHPSAGLPSKTVEEQKEEVMGCHDYVKENFGYEMHLFRYPTGKFSEQSLAIVNNCNYKSVFWSFAYLDYDVNNQPDESESLQKLVDRLHPGAIYLLHAESVTNTHILGRLIDRGRQQGYSFEMFR